MDNPLTTKLGPLPGWAWGAVAVGGIVVYKWYASKSEAATATPVPENSGSTGYEDGTYPGDGSSNDYGATNTSATDNTATGPGGSSITSNLQWTYLATEELVANGNSPTGVSSALYKYLNGLSLTTDEQTYVNKAIQLLGPPPENVGLPVTVTTTPPPAKTPAPKPIPKGPYSYETTNVNIKTVPEIAHHYHLSSATVLLYNPQFIKNGYDLHALPVGIQYRVPSVKGK